MKVNNVKHLVLTAVLAAIIIVMGFTPLGYLRTPGLEITFLQIPVIIGACLMGPGAGAILGAVFGLTSFIQCFGFSVFGAALLSINPIYTFIVCFVPRILMGWLCGLIFKGLNKIDKTRFFSYAGASLSAALLNTVLFMSALVLFFYSTDYIQELASSVNAENIFSFILLFVGINGLVEAITCFVLGTALAKTLAKVFIKLKL